WYELRMKKKGPWEIHQQGTYAPDADDRWLGSITMDKKGKIALGFNVSAASGFPSIRYAVRQAEDHPRPLPLGALWLCAGGGVRRRAAGFHLLRRLQSDDDRPDGRLYLLVHGHLLPCDHHAERLAHSDRLVQIQELPRR